MLCDGLRLLEGSQITNLVVPTGASFPSSPDQGELFFHTGDVTFAQGLYVRRTADWIQLGLGETISVTSGSAASPSIFLSSTAPTGATGPTGLFFPAANQMAVTINGAEQLTFRDNSTAFTTRYVETRNTSSNAGTLTINCQTNTQFTTLTGNITTVAFTNVPNIANTTYTMTLFLTQDATGGRLVTWPDSVKWAGGTAPTLTTTGNRTDVIALVTSNGGTTWFAFVGGFNFNA